MAIFINDHVAVSNLRGQSTNGIVRISGNSKPLWPVLKRFTLHLHPGCSEPGLAFARSLTLRRTVVSDSLSIYRCVLIMKADQTSQWI